MKNLGLAFFRLYTTMKLSISIFIYETNPSIKNFLGNTTNPNMNLSEFFQYFHSRVTFPFLRSSFFPYFFKQHFPVLYTIEIFRKLIDLLYRGSLRDCFNEVILLTILMTLNKLKCIRLQLSLYQFL